MAMARRALVIGGGVAGCSAARELVRGGREVVIVEAADGLGGRARSWHRPDIDPTVGINLWFTNGYEVMFERIKEYGLDEDLVEMTNNLIIVDDGKPAELKSDSIRTLLKFPHLRLRERLAFGALAVRQTRHRKELDVFEPEHMAKVDDGTTAAEWAVDKLSRRVLDKLVRPEIESFWLWRCEEISAAHLMGMQAHLVGARFYVFRRGMETLAEAMAEGTTMHLGTEVTDLTSDGDGVDVTWRSADGEPTQERFDEVVVATNAPVANKLTSTLPTQVVDGTTRRFLETQRYEPALSVCFVADRSAMPSAAHIVPTGDGPHPVRTIITFPRELVRDGTRREVELVFIYPGREETRELIGTSPEHQYERTRELVKPLWPDFPADAEPFVVAERPQGMPMPEPGRYKTSAQIAREQTGPVVFAGDYFCSPTAEAALRSGMRAASSLLRTG